MMVLKKILSVFLFLITLFRRALCCFGRRRVSVDFVPLTHVGIVVNNVKECDAAGDLQAWQNWGDANESKPREPRTVEEHIEFYRKQQALARSNSEDSENGEQDFFEDMAPKVTKQTKVVVGVKDEDVDSLSTSPPRLSMVPESVSVVRLHLFTYTTWVLRILLQGQELEDWDEQEGWEEQTNDWDAEEALRENRKQARQKRLWEQQQRRLERSVNRTPLGGKISSQHN